MRLHDIQDQFPNAGRLIRRLVDEGIDQRAVEGLTHHAIARVETGQTTERDVRLLLVARAAMVGRR